MAGEDTSASGVKELIQRIRDEGVDQGQQEADRLLGEARHQAATILEEARAEADAVRQKARGEIESDQAAALEALKMAARDTSLQLEAEVMAGFERHVKRLVSPVAHDGRFIRTLVLVLAGRVVDEFLEDQDLQILVTHLLDGEKSEHPEAEEGVRDGVLGIAGEMLREGVELISSREVPGGVRVRVVDQELEIDLTDEAISKLLVKLLLPRYRAILEGAE